MESLEPSQNSALSLLNLYHMERTRASANDSPQNAGRCEASLGCTFSVKDPQCTTASGCTTCIHLGGPLEMLELWFSGLPPFSNRHLYVEVVIVQENAIQPRDSQETLRIDDTL